MEMYINDTPERHIPASCQNRSTGATCARDETT